MRHMNWNLSILEGLPAMSREHMRKLDIMRLTINDDGTFSPADNAPDLVYGLPGSKIKAGD